MAAEPHASAGFTEARHHEVRQHTASTAAVVAVFWMAAAGGVIAAQTTLQSHPASASVVTIGSIVLAAYGYTRFGARESGVSHALGVGIAWLVLGIATELIIVMRVGHEWYGILGSPGRPLLRNLYFFVWMFATVLFARREVEE